MYSDLSILFRLFVAVVLCGSLGWEREADGKQAGLRTHILVGVGAAMFVALGESVVRHFGPRYDDMQFDPIRVIEAVVAGISFLGAGTIFVSQGKTQRVEGLTTAAAIWTTAGIGIAIGLERYVLAVGATGLVFCVLRVLGRLTRRGALPGVPPAGTG
jgi:putative Mg2+ transporter-C (MgtC) family protein